MDQTQARALLAGERAQLQRPLRAETGKSEAAELGDDVDDADRGNAEQTGMAVDQLLRARWAALVRAEARLAAGRYGRSVGSGQPIPDERLEADPLAELTIQEEAAAEYGELEEGENAVGLMSADHPFEVLADADITLEEAQASEDDDDEPPPPPSLGIHIERDPGHRSSRPAEATELAEPMPKEAAPFNEVDKDHFAACEQPPLFTAELRAALGSLRQ
jgi:DnaK suppressor protein